MATTILGVVGIAVVVLGGVWLLGDLVARVVGAFLVVVGAGYIIGGVSHGVIMAGAGLFLWLAGHWFFAFKHHAWKSAALRRLFGTSRLQGLDPTRRWAVPVAGVDRPLLAAVRGRTASRA